MVQPLETSSVIEAIGADRRTMQFHVRCFNLWNAERRVPGHEFSDSREVERIR